MGSSLSHVLREEQSDQYVVNMTTMGSGYTPDQPIIHVAGRTGSTTAHADQFTSVLLAQQLPPLPKFSGESDDKESVIGTFQE